MKKWIFVFGFLIFSQSFLAQAEPTGNKDVDFWLYYKRLVDAADSIQAKTKSVEFDTKSVFAEAKKLDTQSHPMFYFEKAQEYYEKGKYNESGFLNYLGKMRATDFNNCDLGYFAKGEKGHLLDESVYLFLSADVDNYKRIIQMAIDFYEKNPYTFLVKNAKGYKKQPVENEYRELVKALSTIKPKDIAEIQEGRKEMIDRINEYYEAYKPAFEKKKK